MNELLIDLAQAAGIGGIAIGVFLILFKKINLPVGTKKKHITLFMWLVWSFCIFGVSSHLIKEYLDRMSRSKVEAALHRDTPESFNIELSCNWHPPGAGSDLAKLFDYAELNEGEIVQVSVKSINCDCPIEEKETPSLEELKLLSASCKRNPKWWGSKYDLNCVRSLALISEMATGIESFCFPTQESLPNRKGYKRGVTAVEESISGEFLVYYEWGGGAAHVQLIIPEV